MSDGIITLVVKSLLLCFWFVEIIRSVIWFTSQGDRRDHDHMVVGLATTYVISVYHH